MRWETFGICVLLLVLLVPAYCDIEVWQKANKGLVRWKPNCNFTSGFDYATEDRSTTHQCGSVCVSRKHCNHFAFANGICYLKHAPKLLKTKWVNGTDCGFVKTRVNDSAWFYVTIKLVMVLCCVTLIKTILPSTVLSSLSQTRYFNPIFEIFIIIMLNVHYYNRFNTMQKNFIFRNRVLVRFITLVLYIL